MDRHQFREEQHFQSSPDLTMQHPGGSNSLGQEVGRAGQVTAHTRPDIGRNPSDGAVASHFLAQPPDAFGGRTWLEFLRETSAEETSPVSRVSSASTRSSASFGGASQLPGNPLRLSSHSLAPGPDRKRRLTTPESPGRRGVPSPGTMANQPGSSVDSPIVLSPSPPRPQLRTHSTTASTRPNMPPMERRESDIILPRWQPDSEVSNCPVCGNAFTFFYRKHHCRKCGRVVCANCSPHRITIPRQFIVHPPSDSPSTRGTFIDLTGDDESPVVSSPGPYRHLGGGEEVRVCNPCVPDPNFSPPPQVPGDWRPSSIAGSPYNALPPHYRGPMNRPLLPQHLSSQSNESSQSQTDPARSRPPDLFTDRRISFHNRTRVSDLFPPPPMPQQSGEYIHPAVRSRPVSQYTPQLLNNPHRHQHSASASSIPPPYRSLLDMNPRASIHAPVPRRQIAEEDECPVCGEELPPKGPDGSTLAREQHVQDCIGSHFGAPVSSPLTAPNTATSAAINASAATPADAQSQQPPAITSSSSLPISRTRGMSNAQQTSSSPSSGHGPAGAGEPSRTRRATTSTRMLVYDATEKDCIGKDGEPQECVICFEEFEQGDRMGRLFCLCKFHRDCIRRWWETKGPGSCPTHQLHV